MKKILIAISLVAALAVSIGVFKKDKVEVGNCYDVDSYILEVTSIKEEAISLRLRYADLQDPQAMMLVFILSIVGNNVEITPDDAKSELTSKVKCSDYEDIFQN